MNRYNLVHVYQDTISPDFVESSPKEVPRSN